MQVDTGLHLKHLTGLVVSLSRVMLGDGEVGSGMCGRAHGVEDEVQPPGH